jgi:hypothetical protein
MACNIPGCACGGKKSISNLLDRLESKRVNKHTPPEAGMVKTDTPKGEYPQAAPPQEPPKEQSNNG